MDSVEVPVELNRSVETNQRSNTTGGGARAPPVELDYWTTEGDKVVRVHVQPRNALFATTAKTVDAEGLGQVRLTRGRNQAGEKFVLHDYWRASRRPQRRQPFQWTGTTTFHYEE